MVRDLLKNQVYTGRVPYAETLYSGSLGEGKQSPRHRKQWFEGKHQGFISDELFDQCQEVRKQLTKHRRSQSKMHTHILHDRVYCARCIVRKPEDIEDVKYGKMRAAYHRRDDLSYYRCLRQSRGYGSCDQRYANADRIDEQVRQAIAHLSIPDDYKARVDAAIQNKVDHADALQRMEEIREIVERIDFSWEKGFMTPEEYIEKRSQLQREIEALRPIQYDDLLEAADLLQHFNTYWDQCNELDNPAEGRKALLQKIVDRVFVYDSEVVAIALHGDFGVILDEQVAMPLEVKYGLEAEIKTTGKTLQNVSSRFGSDGGWGLACILLIPPYSTTDHVAVLSFPRWYPYIRE